MKNSFFALALLLSIPAIVRSYERKLSINLMDKKERTWHAVDPFKKEEFSKKDDTVLKFALASGAANATHLVRTKVGFLVPIVHGMLQMHYLSKCHGESLLTQDCKDLQEILEFIRTLPVEAQKFETMALQESMKLRKDLPEGAHVHVVLAFDAPEVTIAPEGEVTDGSAVSTDSTSAE
jgi:hypothetical protein